MPPPKQPSDEFRPFQLIVRALELEPHEREPFLRQEAAGDRKLFEEALKMLREAEAMPSDPEPAAAEPLRLVTATASAELLKRLMDSARLDETRYQIKDMIGAGGMGRVYLVEDQHLKRSLAMKVPHAISATDPERRPHASVQLGRFLEEAQVTSQLDHPGVVPVHDLGIDKAGQVYFLMRRVTGDTARDAFAKAREGRDGWTIARALEVVLKVCDTMAYAHQKGVLHRDLKPDNIRVGAFGEVYVLDWGLAKVGQQADRHDLRVAGAPVASDREIDAQANSESSVVTMDGTTVGTPFYMSPEQALSQPLDQRTDVYAIGATLYELLAGKPPYDEVDIQAQQVLERVRKGPPTRIERLVAAVPPELVAIVEKAMERDPDDRYPRPSDLAADLRAYLGQRVVSAYRTGRLVELKMLVRRNKGAAALVAALFVSLLVGVVGASAIASRLRATVIDFDLLAATAQLDRASDLSSLLSKWPLRPADLESWLKNNRDQALALGTQLEDAIARLQPTSSSYRDPSLHPSYPDLQKQLRMVVSLERAQALRSGQSKFTATPLPIWHRESDIDALTISASCRTSSSIEQRTVWNEEAQGLAFAEMALAKAQETKSALIAHCTDVLSWALVANGRGEEAKQCAANAIVAADQEHKARYQEKCQRVVEAVDTAQDVLATAKAECERLRTLVQSDIDWTVEREGVDVLYKNLIAMRRRLPELEARRKVVTNYLEWTRKLQELSDHPNAVVRWVDVRQQIRSDPRYAGQEIELKDEDVVGLVPLGRNPRTGYFEFYDLRSAWDWTVDNPVDPEALSIPRHEEDGSIRVTEASGIVFVLLPGGRCKLGCQNHSPEGDCYDELREDGESLHVVQLGAFFIAKHEVTVAQWARLWMGEVGLRYPSVGERAPTHPVDRVSWWQCNSLLSSHGMAFPTEAQWEYAARGGTTTPWAAGARERLPEFANLADATAQAAGLPFVCETWPDGHALLAPVGSFRANAFGLHDMAGNVSEWCRDALAYYGSERDGDGFRAGPGQGRVNRGGAANLLANFARSAVRLHFEPASQKAMLGVRAVRPVSLGAN